MCQLLKAEVLQNFEKKGVDLPAASLVMTVTMVLRSLKHKQ